MKWGTAQPAAVCNRYKEQIATRRCRPARNAVSAARVSVSICISVSICVSVFTCVSVSFCVTESICVSVSTYVSVSSYSRLVVASWVPLSGYNHFKRMTVQVIRWPASMTIIRPLVHNQNISTLLDYYEVWMFFWHNFADLDCKFVQTGKYLWKPFIVLFLQYWRVYGICGGWGGFLH